MKVITIGRSTENNDIVVDDEKVSRNHLQMVMDDNGNYSVVDLGSTNGTFVNGQRISGEVRLKLGDEVRIGQTVLPWQNYFASAPQPPIVNHPLPPQPPKPNPNHTWLYIVIGAILLLLIGGGVAWKIYHDKQKEKVEQEEKRKEQQEQQLEQEANDARVEAARLSEEAEAAARKAAESKSKEDLAYAEKMRIKAEEANNMARQKEEDWTRMKSELDEANEARLNAENQSKKDKEAMEKAEQMAVNAQNAAIEAEKAKQKAEHEAELTRKFYTQIADVKPKDAQKICEKMGWKPSSNESKKDYVTKKFEKGNNTEKTKIISVVEEVLGRQNESGAIGKSNDNSNNGSVIEVDKTPNDTTSKEQ